MKKIENKFPILGFKNLNVYMTAIFVVGTIIYSFNPFYYIYYLSLDVEKVLSGQIYRLFTFIFYPPASSSFLFLSLIMIYVYYQISKTLVIIWGNFKFNLYLFIGYISMILGAIISYFVLGKNIILLPMYTSFSLLMAFALSFPDTYFLIYFIIPIKAKYFAYFELLIYIYMFFSYDNLSNKIAIICSAINVFVFFVLFRKKEW